MAPIRIALIGLSSTAKTSWAAEGHLPYLLSSTGKQHYEIVALLNSSVKAAEAAKSHFGLPSDVKAFGDPAALAANSEIDLVVCNTRVDTHFSTLEPSLRAGKAVFAEWPLAENYKRAVELVGDQVCDNSIIGLQTPLSPALLKLKEVLNSGRIGCALSSDSLSYLGERKIGGNPITIGYAHMVDFVHNLLGEFVSFESRMQIQRPTIKIVDKFSPHINTISSNVPDFLTVHGKIAKGRTDIADDATLAITWRSGQPFKGAPGFVWTINGEKGELRVTIQAGPYLQLDPHGQSITVELHDFATDEVLEMKWDWKDWQKCLPWASRIVGEVYERYASWIENGKITSDVSRENEFPRLHEALVRMNELDLLFKNYDAQ